MVISEGSKCAVAGGLPTPSLCSAAHMRRVVFDLKNLKGLLLAGPLGTVRLTLELLASTSLALRLSHRCRQ